MLEKTFKFTLLQITKNRCELSAMISENVEITCLKWLKNYTCAPIKPSVTNENFIFFSSFIFVFVNLALKSKEVKCYHKWLNLFNLNFNDKFINICSSFLNKTEQLIHLTIDLSRLHKKLNSGKFE